MSSYVNSISKFVAILAQSMEVTPGNHQDGIHQFLTPKYCIYIYLPGAERLANSTSLPTIHIDIDQIEGQSDLLIQRLRGLHGVGKRIFARQTVVARIDKKVTLNFQDEHHLLISLPGKYRYGLFHHGELVSIAVFSGGRLMREEKEGHRSFELIRFCHKEDTLVVGGLSKLLKAFIKDFNPQDIMTYADLDWTNESSLETIGFKEINTLLPQTFYVVNGSRQVNKPQDDDGYYAIKNKGSLKLKLIL